MEGFKGNTPTHNLLGEETWTWVVRVASTAKPIRIKPFGGVVGCGLRKIVTNPLVLVFGESVIIKVEDNVSISL